MKKVAIVQGNIIRGGRLSVILSLIELLNERDVVPDIITARMPSRGEIEEKYHRKVRYNVVKVLSPPLPSDLGILQFHYRVCPLLGAYDLVINTANSNVLMRDDVPIVHYVFFPRKRRAESPLYFIHLPEVRLGGMHPLMLYKALLRKVYRHETVGENTFVVAISDYVRDAILKDFDVPDDQMAVVYPPVDISEFTPDETKEEQVVTLGRFKSYKRQLQQMEIAAQLPEMKFVIIGFISSRSYFRQCRRYQQERHLTNITLYPNAPFSELRRHLQRSRLFMHNVINEPFGLTTVQAIVAGCVPVVHDSGGQREIVSGERLRFSTVEEAVAILRSLKAESDLTDVRESLYEHAVKNFSEDAFKHRMNSIFSKYL
jgi:glycosyltransferase involved in cell wall biosynthesis